jgi:hypothetical protein
MNKEAESRKLAIQALKEAPPATLFQTPVDYIFADHSGTGHSAICSVRPPMKQSWTGTK